MAALFWNELPGFRKLSLSIGVLCLSSLNILFTNIIPKVLDLGLCLFAFPWKFLPSAPSLVYDGVLDVTLLHRCLCIGTKNEHMVFVPVAHEQILAYDVLEMAQAG